MDSSNFIKKLQNINNLPFTLCNTLLYPLDTYGAHRFACEPKSPYTTTKTSALSPSNCNKCMFFYINTTNNELDTLITIADRLHDGQTTTHKKV